MRRLWILLNRIILPLLIITHSAIVIGNLVALVILPFMTPWYIWIPLTTFIVRMIFDENPCPASHLENHIRGKIGKNLISGFVSFYTTSHILALWRKIRGR